MVGCRIEEGVEEGGFVDDERRVVRGNERREIGSRRVRGRRGLLRSPDD